MPTAEGRPTTEIKGVRPALMPGNGCEIRAFTGVREGFSTNGRWPSVMRTLGWPHARIPHEARGCGGMGAAW